MSLTSFEHLEIVTSDHLRLARMGLRGALEVRMRFDIPSWKPICIYDMAEKAGVEVKFCPEKSLGGMYENVSKTILISSFRPPGRKAFTCAHELGHWHFNDGVSVDEIHEIENWHDKSPKEQLANHFAAGILMPHAAVYRAFSRRGWDPSNPSDIQVFTVAGQLGVGYSTLVQHLRWSLDSISNSTASRLLQSNPKEIRLKILGHSNSQNLIMVDGQWESTSVDLEVGDFAFLHPGVAADSCANLATVESRPDGKIVSATRSGITQIRNHQTGWSAFVRVSRKNYCGRSKFRHLEEVEDDD